MVIKKGNDEYGSCSMNVASTNKKNNNKKRDGHNMILEGRKPEPSMTIRVGKIIIPLYY